MEISGELLDLVLYGRQERTLLDRYTPWEGHPLFLPKEVCVLPSTVPGSSFGVFCTTAIKKGSEMGPYPGHVVSKLDETKSAHAWEVGRGRQNIHCTGAIIGYMDGGQNPGNWLTHVQCARTEREQNLEIVQIGTKIFYRAIKEIERGQELLVWYGDTYTLYMGIPACHSKGSINTAKDEYNRTCKEATNQKQEVLTNKLSRPFGLILSGKWHCVLCQRGFNSRSNLRSHMRIHTLEKPFSCKFCARKFSQSSTLRNHIRLHTGEKPYRCVKCNSSYSQLAGLRAHQRSSTHRPTHVHRT
ncbi:PR domain zinc finger protein 12-like [Mercenaria mercenaria]|uniref:PR domain zinc finger protein 12-like n=1 Tax=Mercenaria mercenaria TaxID=6596 RepID=UPI00234EFEF5|nr:PR domain zinc finger protein 12-like [Mercenaria mercenaria]